MTSPIARLHSALSWASLLLCLTTGMARAASRASAAGAVDAHASYATSVALDVPPFRGLEPDLSLTYRTSQQNGWTGVGWALAGASSIDRAAPGGGVPRGDATDVFRLDGQELVACTAMGGTHCPRVQNYQRIVQDATTNVWYAWSKDGTKRTYAPLVGSPTRLWMLSAVTDTRGNQVDYTYACPAAEECYLDKVTYNGVTITFFGETRPDPIERGTGTALASMTRRLKTIQVSVGGQVRSAYSLTYAASGPSGRSLLVGVQRFGRDALVVNGVVTGGTALPSTTLGYTPGTSSPSETARWTPSTSDRARTFQLGDVNGDGRSDLVIPYDAAGTLGLAVYTSNGATQALSSDQVMTGASSTALAWLSGDVNADGKHDVVQAWDNAGALGLNTYLSNGSGYALSSSNAAAATSSTSVAWLSGDVNGDGRTDVVQLRDAGAGALGIHTFLSDGTGLAAAIVQTPAGATSAAVKWLAADVDGDGRTDLVQVVDAASVASVVIHRSTGAGFASLPPASLGVPVAATSWLVGDVNGDGLSDLIQAGLSAGAGVRTFGSTGSSYVSRGEDAALGAGLATSSWQALDRNGDGRTDLVQVSSAAGVVVLTPYLSGSSGFGPGTSVTTTEPLETELGWLAGDVDGDGRADLVRTARGAQVAATVAVTGGAATPLSPIWRIGGIAAISSNTLRFALLALTGGTPIPTLHDVTFAGATVSATGNWCDGGMSGNDGGLIASITTSATGITLVENGGKTCTLGFGGAAVTTGGTFCAAAPGAGNFFMGIVTDGTSAFSLVSGTSACTGQTTFTVGGPTTPAPTVRTYLTGAQSVDLLASVTSPLGATTSIAYVPSSAWPSTYLPLGMVFPTVSAVTTADGRGNAYATTYQYAGALWSDRESRFLGFRRVVAVLDAAGTYTETYYRQRVGDLSKAEVTYTRDAAGNIYHYSLYRYAESTTAPYWSLPTERWDYQCNLGTDCRTTLAQFAYDTYGNITANYAWGDWAVAGDERTSVRGYFPNTTAFIVGLPAYENTYQGIGATATLVGRTRYVYDDNAASEAAPTRGEVTRTERWNSDTGGYAVAATTHDAWGNPTVVTDPTGRSIWTAYDPTYHLYPTAVCDDLGRCTRTDWGDLVLGVPAGVQDANGGVTLLQHDGFGRKIEETRPDGSVTRWQYLDVGLPATQRVVTTVTNAAGTASLVSTAYLDGLGREHRSVRNDGSSRERVFRLATELVSRETHWHEAGEAIQEEVTTYDGVGRPLVVTHPDGSTIQLAYVKGGLTQTDELGRTKTKLHDAYDQVIEVREQNGTASNVTTFAYNVVGQLRRMVDAKGRETLLSWNSLGQRRGSTDPARGTWAHELDLAGRPTRQVDARGLATDTLYDVLGRRQTTLYADGTVASDAYDEPNHGAAIGRLTTRTYPDGSEAITYDALGRPTATTTCVDDECRTIERTYDFAGRVQTLRYPDGTTLTQGFDGAGRLKSVSGYVTEILYNGRDQMRVVSYANGVTTTNVFDAERDWLDSTSAVGPGGAVFQQGLVRDLAGRITSTTSTTNPLSNVTLGLDDLGRLTGTTGAETRSYSYDALGNFLTSSEVGTYSYLDPARPDAPSAIDGDAVTYDANGNVLAVGTTRAFQWDAANRLAASTAAGVTSTYAYTPEGARIRRQTGADTTRYFQGLVDASDEGDAYLVYAGPLLVARWEADGAKRWYHLDHLDSVRAVTNAAGARIALYDRTPYGQPQSGDATLAGGVGWNGHREEEGGLVYMRARYYDSTIGRFLSPDDRVPDAEASQTHNPYAFGTGNPIQNNDPDGHFPDSFSSFSGISNANLGFSSTGTFASSSSFFSGIFGGAGSFYSGGSLFTGAPIGASNIQVSFRNDVQLQPMRASDAAASFDFTAASFDGNAISIPSISGLEAPSSQLEEPTFGDPLYQEMGSARDRRRGPTNAILVLGLTKHLQRFVDMVKYANPNVPVLDYFTWGPLVADLPAEYVMDANTTGTFLWVARKAQRIYFNLQNFDTEDAIRRQGGGGFTNEEFWLILRTPSLLRKTVFFDYREVQGPGGRVSSWTPNTEFTRSGMGGPFRGTGRSY